MVELERSGLPKLIGLLVLSLVLAAPTSAQSPTRMVLGASATANLFVGGSSDFLDGGFGFDAHVSRGVAPHVDIRLDGMMITLADQTSGGETAKNTLVSFGLGPEFSASIPLGEAYLRGMVGIVGNLQSQSNPVAEENASWSGMLGAGLGLRFRMSPTVSIDLGGDVLKLGELDFARTLDSSLRLVDDPAVLRLRAGMRFTVH